MGFLRRDARGGDPSLEDELGEERRGAPGKRTLLDGLPDEHDRIAPGKRTLLDGLPDGRGRIAPGKRTLLDGPPDERGRVAPGKRTLLDGVPAPAGRLAPDPRTLAGDDAIAEAGTSGTPIAFPHKHVIEAAFGRAIDAEAYLDDDSAAAASALGSEAFAHGNRVGFRTAPSLYVAAHEAAHTLQTAGAVRAFSSDGDAYEAHANQAAARVVAGVSASDLFDDRAPQGPAVVRRLTAGEVVDVLARQNYAELQVRALLLLTQLGQLARFDVARGVFEGDLSLGVAWEIIRRLTPGGSVTGLDELEGGARVHLVLDLYHQTFELTAKSLHVLPGTIGLLSGDVRLADVALRSKLGEVTVEIGELVAINGKAVRDASSAQLDALYLRGVRAHVTGSLRSIATGATFREARIHGLRIPGAPIADLDLEDSGVGLAALWDAVWERARLAAIRFGTDEAMRRAGLKPASTPAPEGPVQLPQVLPPGARIQLQMKGAVGAARENMPWDHDVVAVLEGLRIAAVDGDGRELASIAISGVTSRAGATPGLDLRRVVVTGSAALVPALLDGDSPLIPHQAKAALEKLRPHFTALAARDGARPVATLTLGPIHLDLAPGHDELRVDNLDLDLRDGAAHVTVTGRGLAASTAGRGDVPTLVLRLLDDEREVAAVTLTNFTGTYAAGRATGDLERIEITGDAARVPHLLRAIDKHSPALPANVRAALARLATRIPRAQAAISASDLHVERDATSARATLGPVHAAIVVPNVGRLDVTLVGGEAGSSTGANARPQPGATREAAPPAKDPTEARAGFARFDAVLTSVVGEVVASVRAVGGRAQRRGASNRAGIERITADGDTRAIADLFDALGRQVPQLPGSLRAATELVLSHRVSLGAVFHAEATGLAADDRGARAAAVGARLELAKQRGVAVVGMVGARHEGGVTRFDRIELALENTPAKITVRGGRLSPNAAHVDSIEATVGSAQLLPVLEPAMLALMPAELVAALAPLRWTIESFVANDVNAGRGPSGAIDASARDLALRGALAIETVDGTRYACDDASVTVRGPSGSHDGKGDAIGASGLEISGAFAVAPKTGAGFSAKGTITTGLAHVAISGDAMTVSVDRITAALHAAMVPGPAAPDTDTDLADAERNLANAREHLPKITSLDLGVSVPVRALGPIAAGTRLGVGLHTDGNLLARAWVTADPPIRAYGGAIRKVEFAHGTFELDVGGLLAVLNLPFDLANAALRASGFRAELTKLLDLAAGLVTERLRASVNADQDWADTPDDGRRPADPFDPWADEDRAPAPAPAPQAALDLAKLIDVAAATGTLDVALAVADPVEAASRIHGAIHGTAIDLAMPATTARRGGDRVEVGPTSGTVSVDPAAKTLDVTSFTIRSFTWTRRPRD